MTQTTRQKQTTEAAHLLFTVTRDLREQARACVSAGGVYAERAAEYERLAEQFRTLAHNVIDLETEPEGGSSTTRHTITIEISEAEGRALVTFLKDPLRIQARHDIESVVDRLAIEARDNLGFEASSMTGDCEACGGTGQTEFMAGSYESCSECMGSGRGPQDGEGYCGNCQYRSDDPESFETETGDIRCPRCGAEEPTVQIYSVDA